MHQIAKRRSVEFGEEGAVLNARDLEVDDVLWALHTSLLPTAKHRLSIAHRLSYGIPADVSLCAGHFPLELLRLRTARSRDKRQRSSRRCGLTEPRNAV